MTRLRRYLAGLAAGLLVALPVAAQKVPSSAAEVARPGGKVPGAPKIALVKVADGFNDPVGVTAANDGSGRIFVVERVGRVRLVGKGRQGAEGAVPRPDQLQPARHRRADRLRRAGPVVDGAAPEVQGQRVRVRALRVAAVSTARRWSRASRSIRKSPNRITKDQLVKSAKVLMNIPQPYYNHYGGTIAFGPDGKLYIGKGDAGLGGRSARRRPTARCAVGQAAAHRRGRARRRRLRDPEGQPVRQGRQAATDVAVRHHRAGLLDHQDRLASGDLGLRPAQHVHVSTSTRSRATSSSPTWGKNHWEEIDYQPAGSKGGENYGWKHNQGSHCHPTTGPGEKCPTVGLLPAAEYPHQEPYPGG